MTDVAVSTYGIVLINCTNQMFHSKMGKWKMENGKWKMENGVELQVSVLPLLTILLFCSNRDSSKRDLNLRRLNDR